MPIPQPPEPAPEPKPPYRIPVALKVTHTAFVSVVVPTYWRQYGPGNFLWFSDVALLASVPALWFESPLVASTQVVGVLVPECLWLVDFGAGLFAGRTPIGLASYMFNRRIPRFVRALSLFHLWLTPVLVVIVSRVGYDRRAFKYQTMVTAVVLLASWQLTKPHDNVNWVYSRREEIRSPAARAGFVFLLMAAIPLAFHLPIHLLFKRLFRAPTENQLDLGRSAMSKMPRCPIWPDGATTWRSR
jgi:hypothetical protein